MCEEINLIVDSLLISLNLNGLQPVHALHFDFTLPLSILKFKFVSIT